MALRPIDLQTMFMRMGELSREQAAAQESSAQKLAAQDARMAKLAKDNDERVSGLSEVPEGPDKINDEREGPEHRRGRKAPHREETMEPSAEDTEVKPENTELRESYLGTKIDIQG